MNEEIGKGMYGPDYSKDIQRMQDFSQRLKEGDLEAKKLAQKILQKVHFENKDGLEYNAKVSSNEFQGINYGHNNG